MKTSTTRHDDDIDLGEDFVVWRPGEPCPRCSRRHRTWGAVAECRLGPTLWLHAGPDASGPCWATISDCPHRGAKVSRTVVLHASLSRAKDALDFIRKLGCGARCWKDHHLIDLLEPIDPEDVQP